jgi:hypothetical protein
VTDTLRTYISLAEKLDMVVTLGEGAIKKEDAATIAGNYFRSAETAKDLLGTAKPVRRRELGPPLSIRDSDRYRQTLEKIHERHFEFLDSVAYVLCMQCGVTFEVNDKWRRRKEDELGIRVESDNQYYQMAWCRLCYGEWPDEITVEELPSH